MSNGDVLFLIIRKLYFLFVGGGVVIIRKSSNEVVCICCYGCGLNFLFGCIFLFVCDVFVNCGVEECWFLRNECYMFL